jgi:hypothetical protein
MVELLTTQLVVSLFVLSLMRRNESSLSFACLGFIREEGFAVSGFIREEGSCSGFHSYEQNVITCRTGTLINDSGRRGARGVGCSRLKHKVRIIL